MALRIRFQGGPRAGKAVEFGDDVNSVSVGRDPDQCQVVFPPEETKVGRVHLTLRREAGRYRLILNQDDVVLVDGKDAHDNQELGAEADLQLGRGGPKLVVDTVLRADLPSTEGVEHHAGAATIAQKSSKSANRALIAGGLSILAVLVVVGLIWQLSGRTGDVEQRVDSVEGRVAQIEQLDERQRDQLAQLGQKHKLLATQIEQVAPRLPEILKSAADSVYLVIIRDAEGNESPGATAWVVDQQQGVLATNSHVADLFHYVPPDGAMIVRSNAEQPRDFVITSVQKHPGYNAFNELWAGYSPVRRSVAGFLDRIGAAGACDVALMQVESNEGLAAALPLLPPEEIGSLETGYAVGYVGYPMEGLALGGVNLRSPTPTTHMGYITAVTDYFGASSVASSDRLLVQHALPATGGASGSPILDGSGNVVAILSAGNVIGATEVARIGSSVNVNFAERIDLLAELLAGLADQRQPQRTEGWRQMIADHYLPRTETLHQDALEAWQSDWSAQAVVKGVTQVGQAQGRLAEQSEYLGYDSRHTVSLPHGGPCLVVATSAAGEVLSQLGVYAEIGGERLTVAEASPGRLDSILFLDFQAASQFDVEIVVSGQLQDAEVTAEVYLLEFAPPLEQRDGIVSQWLSSLEGTGGSSQADLLLDEQTRLGDDAYVVYRIEQPQAGHYLGVAVAPGGEDVDLSVWRLSGGEWSELVSDTYYNPWPSGRFELSQQADVLEVYVEGPSSGIEVELQVYFLPPAG